MCLHKANGSSVRIERAVCPNMVTVCSLHTSSKGSNGVCILTLDKSHRSDSGRQQEEDLYKETSLHVRLRSAHHCLPPHTVAAGHHRGSLPHGATKGELSVCHCLFLYYKYKSALLKAIKTGLQTNESDGNIK